MLYFLASNQLAISDDNQKCWSLLQRFWFNNQLIPQNSPAFLTTKSAKRFNIYKENYPNYYRLIDKYEQTEIA